MKEYQARQVGIITHYVWTNNHMWEEVRNLGTATPRLYELEDIDGLSDQYYITHECRANKRVTVRRRVGRCTT